MPKKNRGTPRSSFRLSERVVSQLADLVELLPAQSKSDALRLIIERTHSQLSASKAAADRRK